MVKDQKVPIARKAMNEDPVPDIPFKEGPVRPYVVTEPRKELVGLRTVKDMKEKILISLLLVTASFIRLYNLEWPDSVVFDEVHFGGFASQYIKGEFFFDLHPPLAKMLFAAVASYAGFSGDFAFENIGDLFPPTTPYVWMRAFSAVLGVLTILFLYLTLRASGVRIWIAFICALCFTVENSFVTISRYILLDAPLMFFMAATVYSLKKYELYPADSFAGIKTLITAGIALGFTASSKWVGLYTFAWVGLICVWRMWFLVGDLSRPISSTFKIAVSKILALVVVPFTLYLFFFHIHFSTLYKDGEGSSFYSSAFRTTLEGNKIPNNIVRDVGITSTVSLRHVGTRGGYLHSHPSNYETGSFQQQITLYPHLDGNNDWLIELSSNGPVTKRTFTNLTNMATIRLVHYSTHCRLHSHDHKAPVSQNADWQTEVSCYGPTGFEGDSNDDWIVEIDKDASEEGEAQERIIALKTKFRLRHALSSCYLFSHEVKLPAWGFEQQEVTCATQGRHDLSLWYVEENINPLLPQDAERISYEKPTFWQKFIETNKLMWDINKNLVETHVYGSYPDSWPFLLRGINYWGHDNRNVYLFGNAIMWWSVSLFVIVFGVLVCYEIIAWQTGSKILQDSHIINFHIQVIHYLLGFALHYVPSFLMKRQMFLHHYLPAYYFGILAFAHALDIVVSHVCRRKKIVGYGFVIAFAIACIAFFNYYKPLVYGIPWTKEMCKKSQWLSGWDYNCDTYLNSYEEYANQTTRVFGIEPTSTP